MGNLVLRGLFVALFLATTAYADTTEPAVGETETSASAPGPWSLDHYYLSYFANLEGSRLSDLGTAFQVDHNGTPTKQAMYLASTVTAAYMVTPTIGVGTYLEMNITPLTGKGITFLDVGLETFDLKLISQNGLTVYANAIAELPTSSYDINRGMYAGFETTPYIRYVLPASRFTVGAWTEVKNYAGSRSGKLIKTWWNPYVSYALGPKLEANLGYELEYDTFAGAPGGFSVYESDFQPGVSWLVAPHVVINPYLQFFTNNKLSYDTIAFGANIVARVL